MGSRLVTGGNEAVAIEFALPERGGNLDVSELGIPVSSATEDAWAGVRAALLDASSEDGGARTMADLEPGEDLRQLNLVLGVGLGATPEAGDYAEPPGSGCVMLYVAEPVSVETAVNYVATAHSVAALASGEASVQVVHTGPIDLLAHRFRIRPAPGGVSIGHGSVTAGTLGCLCRGRTQPRSGLMLALSNNHVLAAVNQGNAGDPVYQPGPYDGGTPRVNQLGTLERFVNIGFSRTNYVDCATALVDPSDVRPEMVRLAQGVPRYFPIGSTTIPAQPGMTVGKSGRTTQITAGRVHAVGVTIRVNMGGGQIATFDDQIEIQGLTGAFCRGGDSGSLVWTWYGKHEAVGLLFAGGSQSAFANPMNLVTQALNIDLL